MRTARLRVAADPKSISPRALDFLDLDATSLLRLRGDAARERVASLVERFDAAIDYADVRIARAALGV